MKKTAVLYYLKKNNMLNEWIYVTRKKLYLVIFLRSQRILHFLLENMWAKHWTYKRHINLGQFFLSLKWKKWKSLCGIMREPGGGDNRNFTYVFPFKCLRFRVVNIKWDPVRGVHYYLFRKVPINFIPFLDKCTYI